jgi:predicted MFS family arabinose efflux permease
VALAVDAASFAASAVALGVIRTPEAAPAPAPASPRRGVRAELGEGLRVVGGHPVLRALAGQIATLQLAGGITTTLLVLYATRDLGFPPAFLGALGAVFGVVALLTALAQGRVAARLDRRRALIGSLLLIGLGNVCVPLTGVWPGAAAPLLVVRMVLHGLAAPVFNAASVGLRQVVTPERLQGRVSATIRFVGWGLLPAGALLGGLLAERLGVLPALTVAAVISLAACLWPLLLMPRAIEPVEPPAPVARTGCGGLEIVSHSPASAGDERG